MSGSFSSLEEVFPNTSGVIIVAVSELITTWEVLVQKVWQMQRQLY
jgi:hypothetical protein